MDDSNFCSDSSTLNMFLGNEYAATDLKDADVVIIPTPIEFSTSYGKGTQNGPAAILNASSYVEIYDEEIDYEAWKCGIFTTTPVEQTENQAANIKAVQNAVAEHLEKNKFVIVLGGEHSISSGVFRAFSEKYKDISILQLDAHADLRNSYENSGYSHACVMRRIYEFNKNIVQVGIRSLDIEEKRFISEKKINTFFAHEIRRTGFDRNIFNLLTDNVFITIDVDFFDPSIMPSTGTPEPGGFLWYETLAFLKEIFKRKNVVGFDVVELSPVTNIVHPDFLTAKLIYKLVGYRQLGR